MSEETHNAAMAGPLGIIMAIGVSAVLGWFLILGLLFSMQDYDTTITSPTGQPVTQIFLDTVGEKGAIVLMVGLRLLKTHKQSTNYLLLLRSLSSEPCSSGLSSNSLRSRWLTWLQWNVLDHVQFPYDVRLCSRWRHSWPPFLPQGGC
jgi:hypothetical protein